MPSAQFRVVKTAQGFVGFLATERGLRKLQLPQSSKAAAIKGLGTEARGAIESQTLMPKLADDLVRYFGGERVEFELRYDWSGSTGFEMDVWRACARVKYGTTASYKDLAASVGSPGAARAVGTVMARNRCPLVIPCHRIVKSDGSLGGYSGPGGLEQKRRLLDLEAAVAFSLK